MGYPQRRDPALRPRTRDCGAHQRRGGAAAGGGERGAGLTAAVFPFGKVMGGRAAHHFSEHGDKRVHGFVPESGGGAIERGEDK